MKILKNNFLFILFITLLIFGISACDRSGGGENGGESSEFKVYNQDNDDYLNDEEFEQAVSDSAYFDKWQQDNDQFLSEDEWQTGINDHLGGYKISTVGKFGQWDLDGDNQLSKDEFSEGLFGVVDKDGNRQISESEFKNWKKEGRGDSSDSSKSSGEEK